MLTSFLATKSKVLDMQGSQDFELQSHQQLLVEGTGLFRPLWARSRLGFRPRGGSICSLLYPAGSEPPLDQVCPIDLSAETACFTHLY